MKDAPFFYSFSKPTKTTTIAFKRKKKDKLIKIKPPTQQQ